LDSDREARIETALRRAADGDSEAFAELVREHQAMVFSVGWHYLGDRSLAEDVAQEVFLELHQSLGRIESAAHLRHWLRRVAVHRSIDQGQAERLPQRAHQEFGEREGLGVRAHLGVDARPFHHGDTEARRSHEFWMATIIHFPHFGIHPWNKAKLCELKSSPCLCASVVKDCE
jgi:RNA polymerase sigma factor (sigma-70 family)